MFVRPTQQPTWSSATTHLRLATHRLKTTDLDHHRSVSQNTDIFKPQAPFICTALGSGAPHDHGPPQGAPRPSDERLGCRTEGHICSIGRVINSISILRPLPRRRWVQQDSWAGRGQVESLGPGPDHRVWFMATPQSSPVHCVVHSRNVEVLCEYWVVSLQ